MSSGGSLTIRPAGPALVRSRLAGYVELWLGLWTGCATP